MASIPTPPTTLVMYPIHVHNQRKVATSSNMVCPANLDKTGRPSWASGNATEFVRSTLHSQVESRGYICESISFVTRCEENWLFGKKINKYQC